MKSWGRRKAKRETPVTHVPIKTHPCSILQVPTTQLAKMSIDLKFVELTADVLEIFFINSFPPVMASRVLT